jgi:hypothetical protein
MSAQQLDRVVGQVERRLLEDAQNHCDRGRYGDGGRAQDADESLVSGIPAKANRNIENITLTMGECCPGPARDGERAHRADAVGEQIEHRR